MRGLVQKEGSFHQESYGHSPEEKGVLDEMSTKGPPQGGSTARSQKSGFSGLLISNQDMPRTLTPFELLWSWYNECFSLAFCFLTCLLTDFLVNGF